MGIHSHDVNINPLAFYEFSFSKGMLCDAKRTPMSTNLKRTQHEHSNSHDIVTSFVMCGALTRFAFARDQVCRRLNPRGTGRDKKGIRDDRKSVVLVEGPTYSGEIALDDAGKIQETKHDLCSVKFQLTRSRKGKRLSAALSLARPRLPESSASATSRGAPGDCSEPPQQHL